jgi:hypothetical protein
MSFKFDDAVVEEYSAMVSQISNEYGKKYQMIDRNDISQEVWMWFVTHPRKLANWKAENGEDTKSVDRLVAKSLRNAAQAFCSKEKAAVEGYNPSDMFFYRKEFVKMLLPAVILDDWSRLENALSIGGKTSTPPAEANDWMAYMADIQKALDKLSDSEKQLITQFYGNDLDGATLHETVAPEKSTARAAMMQANRALNKMVKFLGGFPAYNEKDDEEKIDDVQEL